MRLFNYYPHTRETDAELEKKIFRYSLIIPCLFLFVFWAVFLTEILFQLNLAEWGIYPLRGKGLKGIVFSPFIHSTLSHLAANSIPFLVLSFSLRGCHPLR